MIRLKVQNVWIGCCDMIVWTIQASFISFQASYCSSGYVLIRRYMLSNIYASSKMFLK